MFSENEASTLASLLMDYENGTPEYDSAIRKLLAARDPQQEQDFTNDNLELILDAMEEYYRDTAEYLTPSYYSQSFASPAAPGIFSERETIFHLRERIRKELAARQTES